MKPPEILRLYNSVIVKIPYKSVIFDFFRNLATYKWFSTSCFNRMPILYIPISHPPSCNWNPVQEGPFALQYMLHSKSFNTSGTRKKQLIPQYICVLFRNYFQPDISCYLAFLLGINCSFLNSDSSIDWRDKIFVTSSPWVLDRWWKIVVSATKTENVMETNQKKSEWHSSASANFFQSRAKISTKR